MQTPTEQVIRCHTDNTYNEWYVPYYKREVNNGEFDIGELSGSSLHECGN